MLPCVSFSLQYISFSLLHKNLKSNNKIYEMKKIMVQACSLICKCHTNEKEK